MLFWGMIAILALLLVLRLWLGPSSGASPTRESPPVDSPAPEAEEPELWTADALARLGTEETLEDLAAQGRADKLRDLGYRGDIPGEE